MKKSIVDGVTNYAELFKEGEVTWNYLVRKDGSMSLYATHPAIHGHGVVSDTLDGKAPNERAQAVIDRLQEMADALNGFLQAIK